MALSYLPLQQLVCEVFFSWFSEAGFLSVALAFLELTL